MASKIWEVDLKCHPSHIGSRWDMFEDFLLAGMLGFFSHLNLPSHLRRRNRNHYNCEIQVKKMGGCIKIPMKTVGLSTAGCHWNTPPFQVDWVSQAGLKPHVLAAKQEIFGWWKLEAISKVITPLIGVKSPHLLYHYCTIYNDYILMGYITHFQLVGVHFVWWGWSASALAWAFSHQR